MGTRCCELSAPQNKTHTPQIYSAMAIKVGVSLAWQLRRNDRVLVYRIRILLACQKGADLQGYAADQMASQELQMGLKERHSKMASDQSPSILFYKFSWGHSPPPWQQSWCVIPPHTIGILQTNFSREYGIYPVSGLHAGQFHWVTWHM